MEFIASRELVPELVVRATTGSTNGELVEWARTDDLLSFTTLVTTDQTAGRGRAGRTWVAPAGASLAVSVYVVPRDAAGAPLSFDRFGWLPIAAGVAMAETVAAVVPRAAANIARVGFKWPNDVLIDDRKVCGVLTELVAERHAVVIGAGINLEMTEAQLPIPAAISLALAGVATDDRQPDAVLAAYLRCLRDLVEAFCRTGGDAAASGLRQRALTSCMTLGRDVRVELPDGSIAYGTARDLDADGRLIVSRTDRGDGAGSAGADGDLAVAAGDVTHLRHA